MLKCAPIYTKCVTIQRRTRLVYTDCPADEAGNVQSLAAMGMGDDPSPMITEVTVALEASDGQTKMVLTHAGIPADSPGASGWEQALDKLAAYIEQGNG